MECYDWSVGKSITLTNAAKHHDFLGLQHVLDTAIATTNSESLPTGVVPMDGDSLAATALWILLAAALAVYREFVYIENGDGSSRNVAWYELPRRYHLGWCVQPDEVQEAYIWHLFLRHPFRQIHALEDEVEKRMRDAGLVGE